MITSIQTQLDIRIKSIDEATQEISRISAENIQLSASLLSAQSSISTYKNNSDIHLNSIEHLKQNISTLMETIAEKERFLMFARHKSNELDSDLKLLRSENSINQNFFFEQYKGVGILEMKVTSLEDSLEISSSELMRVREQLSKLELQNISLQNEMIKMNNDFLSQSSSQLKTIHILETKLFSFEVPSHDDKSNVLDENKLHQQIDIYNRSRSTFIYIHKNYYMFSMINLVYIVAGLKA